MLGKISIFGHFLTLGRDDPASKNDQKYKIFPSTHPPTHPPTHGRSNSLPSSAFHGREGGGAPRTAGPLGPGPLHAAEREVIGAITLQKRKKN